MPHYWYTATIEQYPSETVIRILIMDQFNKLFSIN